MSLLFNMLPRFVMPLLPKSKYLLISWLQVTIQSNFGAPPHQKSATTSTIPPYICHEVIGLDAMIFSSVQSLSRIQLFATSWIVARQASLSITKPGLLKLMSIKSVMPSNHFILCHFLPFLPSVFPGIRVFSKESVLRIKWPNNWSFSFNISPSS